MTSSRSNHHLREYDFAWRARFFTGFVAMEHLLAFVLKILLFLGQVKRLGPNCNGYIYANSVIKVQVTVSFCLALNWILKPDDGKRISTIVGAPMDDCNKDSSNTRIKY